MDFFFHNVHRKTRTKGPNCLLYLSHSLSSTSTHKWSVLHLVGALMEHFIDGSALVRLC